MREIFLLIALIATLTTHTAAEGELISLPLPHSYTPSYSTEWVDNFSIQTPQTEKHIEDAIITAYCPCVKCCGQWSSDIWGGEPHTASGTVATAGRTVGCDPDILPYGTSIWIDGHEYIVEDTGSGLCKGKLHLDIYCDTHEEAIRYGRRIREVIWETEG